MTYGLPTQRAFKKPESAPNSALLEGLVLERLALERLRDRLSRNANHAKTKALAAIRPEAIRRPPEPLDDIAQSPVL